MPKPDRRFVPLTSQNRIQPLDRDEDTSGEEAGRWARFKAGTVGQIVAGLLPFLLVAVVLVLAIAIFFGVSAKAALALLGLGAVGLGAFVAAHN
ncbi:MAG: hypothetical protein P1U55_12890 [Vannielia sp.]|nr:hypothetical protein [Vannielia sp.]